MEHHSDNINYICHHLNFINSQNVAELHKPSFPSLFISENIKKSQVPSDIFASGKVSISSNTPVLGYCIVMLYIIARMRVCNTLQVYFKLLYCCLFDRWLVYKHCAVQRHNSKVNILAVYSSVR